MFGGIIAHGAVVVSARRRDEGGLTLMIKAPTILAGGVVRGDSIAVDGVCLTAIEIDDTHLTFDVVPETLDRSTLAHTSEGTFLNVESSLRLGDRLGGHFVYGHVDAVGTILEKRPEGQGFRLIIAMPERLRRYIVEKGYVAIDGISLTVASVTADTFSIALIPETAERTTLGRKSAGSTVNVELDPIARYACDLAAKYIAVDVTDAERADELAWAYEI